MAADGVTSAVGPPLRLAEQAAARPDEPAIVVEGGEDLTFGDWDRRSGAVARGLVERGIGPGGRVALRFEAARWSEYAIAYVAVLKAGATAVLVPAGLAAADAARAVRHSGAAGIVCMPCTFPGGSAWVATVGDLEQGDLEQGDLEQGDGPQPWADLLAPAHGDLRYPLVPLSRPRGCTAGSELFLAPPGRLVHAWAPASDLGQRALAHVLAGHGTTVATLARFSPEALCALVTRLDATTCGLTPGLAAALAASGAAGPSGLRSVTRVVIGPGPVGPALRSRLAATFPEAAVVGLDDPAHPSPVEADPPVGSSQVGMLWHEQLAPASFNMPSLVRRYRGPLDKAALERALGEMIRRHEPLRTGFEVVAGAARQVVRDATGFRLPVVDLGDLPPAARDAAVVQRIADASGRPFDLVEDDLFAPSLVRLGFDDHVLVVRLHHTAFDDWSVDVFRRELSALYTAALPTAALPSAFLDGAPSPLPEPPTTFAEVCRRQQARILGEVGDRQRSAWRARMAGAPLAVQLRLGERHQIGPDRPGAGEPVRHDLPPELAACVRALAPRLRATPFMTVMAAFEVLVARRTGQDDLVLASVVAGRGSTAIEPLIGCFTKKVLLRLRLDGDPTFAEIVARTRRTILDALADQDLPFEAVVQDTLGRAAAAHGLVAQVPIVFQGETPQQARLVLPGLTIGPYEAPAAARRETHFSAPRDDDAPGPAWGDGAYLGTFLLLSLLETGDGLAFLARGVFHRPDAERLLADLEDVIEEVTADPDRRLSDLNPSDPVDPAPADELAFRGLRLSRSRIEAALAHCPGVAEVAVTVDDTDGEPRLVAHVVPDGRPPTLPELRAALWATLPGSPWPAAAFVVDEFPVHDGTPPGPPLAALPAPDAVVVTALWAESAGREVTPGTSYWQDFSFLTALAQARAAGLPLPDELVARCRTPEMLAAALALHSRGAERIPS